MPNLLTGCVVVAYWAMVAAGISLLVLGVMLGILFWSRLVFGVLKVVLSGTCLCEWDMSVAYHRMAEQVEDALYEYRYGRRRCTLYHIKWQVGSALALVNVPALYLAVFYSLNRCGGTLFILFTPMICT